MDIVGIFNVLKTHAQSTGLFGAVLTHEPKSAPTSTMTCCILYSNLMPVLRGSGLNATSAKLTVTVRVMRNMMSQPLDDIDIDILNAVDTLMAAYVGDFSLGSKARSIDIRGMEGEPVSAPAGYIPLDNAIFRAADIRLPIIINDAWTEAP